MMMRGLVLLWVLATAVLVVSGVEASDAVVSLDEVATPKTSSLLEMGEGDTLQMSAEVREQFKADFLNLAAQIHTPKLRSNVMIAERMTSDALDRDDAGGGMDLIFDKLEELSQEIKDEQADDDAWIAGERDTAAKQIAEYSKAIEDAELKISENNNANADDQNNINTWRQQWYTSRDAEAGAGGTHPVLKAMESTRSTETAIVREQVDERNQALDVLIEALFLVCERFNRYKNTELCVQIKSQPDVEEPDRYETKEPTEAEAETDELHAEGSAFAEEWANQQLIDSHKEDVMCPEHPDNCPAANKSGIPLINSVEITAEDQYKFDNVLVARPGLCAERCDENDNCKSFTYNRLTQYCDLFTVEGTQQESDDHVSGVKPSTDDVVDGTGGSALSVLELQEHDDEAEKVALKRLQQLATVQLPARYSVPIQELTVALQTKDSDEAGTQAGAKKRKTIVEILIAIIEETREEQASAKETHQQKLDAWYAQAWLAWDALLAQQTEQAQLHGDWRAARQRIRGRVADSNIQMVTVKSALGGMDSTALELKESQREYGVQTALRDEDQENLVKLRSLLRALYDKSAPAACARTAGVLCTDKVAGWCVFSERVGRDQRCSCNVGFYGVACQLKMCPGQGDVLYKHDEDSVCSNSPAEARGDSTMMGKGCDNTLGECHCAADFYHGPAMKCEYRHAPPSKYPTDGSGYLQKAGTIDQQCSGHGTVNKLTGVCTCDFDWWGPAPNAIQRGGACEERKCPGGGQDVSNGLKFPRVNTNACNNRGSCNPEDGQCSCGQPYSGVMCEATGCPADCNQGQNGECQTTTGTCQCKQSPIKFSGPSCMFMDCPADCGRPSGGECDRNDGHCICKMGYSGDSCERSSRCTMASLKTEQTNWYTIWDKPGWIVCPAGQLLTGLKRRNCMALSCLDSGSCAAGCEGMSKVYQIRHCYHDLGWYNSFDMSGWSKCLPDYFMAGLYRSCESLYCLQIGKCCSMKEVRWSGAPNPCSEVTWAADFKESGNGNLGAEGQHAFITGFFRKRGHDLASLEKASYCEFVRNY